MKKICLLLMFLLTIKCFAATTCEQGRLYDCAANSLYLFCSLTDNKISYENCTDLLPITEKGNSMLELTNALKKCGFKTESKIIKAEDITKVKSPSIVFHYPKNKTDKLGHYFIIIPHKNKVSIYDYPEEVQTFSADFLASSLKQNNINEFPIIMCKAKKKPEEDNGSQKLIKMDGEIIFKDFDEQLTGELNFGNQPESSQIECCFNLINMSSKPIELQDIEADCKCSKISANETQVKPGNSCKIAMNISLIRKYKDIAVKGRVRIKQVDAANSTNLMLLIRGYSEPRVLCNPQKINFGTIKANSGLAKLKDIKILKTKFSKNQEVNIKPTSSNINILNIEQNIDLIKFDVTLDSNNSIGLETSKINVFLDNESESANYFDITASVKLDYAISPKVAIIKKGKESIITVTPKEQKFVIEKVMLCENSDYFNVSCSNEMNCSKIYISVSNKEPPKKLIEDFVEVVTRLKDTEKEKILRISIIYIPPNPILDL